LKDEKNVAGRLKEILLDGNLEPWPVVAELFIGVRR
jgi:hypothetical protein